MQRREGQSIYHLDIFENITEQKTILIPAGNEYHYLAVVMGNSDIDLQLQSEDEHSCVYANCLTIWSATPSKVNMQAYLWHSHSAAHLHMVTMLLEHSDAIVHGGVTIAPDIIKAEGRLLEENIVLGKKVKIHTLPQLDVRSNDVAASHGARIEKLDEKKLFYLQSKGISPAESKRLMIEGFVETMFALITPADWDARTADFSDIKQKVLEQILK